MGYPNWLCQKHVRSLWKGNNILFFWLLPPDEECCCWGMIASLVLYWLLNCLTMHIHAHLSNMLISHTNKQVHSHSSFQCFFLSFHIINFVSVCINCHCKRFFLGLKTPSPLCTGIFSQYKVLIYFCPNILVSSNNSKKKKKTTATWKRFSQNRCLLLWFYMSF